MKSNFAQLYFRLAIGVAFFILGLDRLGAWGPYGSKNVSWGDWQHFYTYARSLMFFLPDSLAFVGAAIATACEILFGILLVIGLFTRAAAVGGAVLTFSFAICMALANGIMSPINYSVFAVSAGFCMLANVPAYKWSIDALIKSKKQDK